MGIYYIHLRSSYTQPHSYSSKWYLNTLLSKKKRSASQNEKLFMNNESTSWSLPKQPSSSSPDGQSKKPSHRRRLSTLCLQEHSISSLTSGQSTWPSHQAVCGMHMAGFVQANSYGSQLGSAKYNM